MSYGLGCSNQKNESTTSMICEEQHRKHFHLAIFTGDVGPNTGGMGAYAPAPLLNASLRHQCMGIVQATVTAMAAEGCPYQGVLYAGTSHPIS
jgi:phosphoribosylamine-glycine ligase